MANGNDRRPDPKGRTQHGHGGLQPLRGGPETKRRADLTQTDKTEHPPAFAKNASLPLSIGTMLDNRYRITGIVGRGGFGAVYSARHHISGANVAIKVLLNRTAGNRKEAEERFFKEARVMAKLRHPNTVRVHDVGHTHTGDLYFAMELLDGPNLEQLLAALREKGTTLTEPQAIDIITPVLGSLGEAHKLGLVHRDLKPANIVLAHVPNEPYCVKVLDFGVVRTAGSDLTTRQTALGTPIYMSPEQCNTAKLDGRSDLYAIGTMLFEMVTGRTPFDRGNPIEVMFEQMNTPAPDLRKYAVHKHSPGFTLAIRKALQKEPKRRFQSASEMRDTLQLIRRESWPDAPKTHLAELLDGPIRHRLSSSFKVVVGGELKPGGLTEAGVRVGTSSAEEPLPESFDAATDKEPRKSLPASNPPRNDTQLDAKHSGSDRTIFDPAAPLGPVRRVTNPHIAQAKVPMRQPSRRIHAKTEPRARPVGPREVPPRRTSDVNDRSRPVPPRPAWTDSSKAARAKLPDGQSQRVLRLPSQSEIAEAIEAHLRKKAAKRSEAPTVLDPPKGSESPRAAAQGNDRPPAPSNDPADLPRLPQVAPPGANETKGPGRTKLGKGTIIGTGIPIPQHLFEPDDNDR